MTLARLTILSLVGIISTALGVYVVTPRPVAPLEAMRIGPMPVELETSDAEEDSASPPTPPLPSATVSAPPAVPERRPVRRGQLDVAPAPVKSPPPSASAPPAPVAVQASPPGAINETATRQLAAAPPAPVAVQASPSGAINEGAIRKTIETRILSGKGSLDEIKMLIALCKRQGDTACVERAVRLLRVRQQ